MSNSSPTEILILGAGLSGLTSASILIDQGKSVKILESRERVGGRIHTVGLSKNKPIELGATWLGNKHKNLIHLLQSLDLEIFKQEIGGKAIFEPISTSPPYTVSVPESNEPSYRIKGGSSLLIEKLLEKIGSENIILLETVKSIRTHEDGLEVQTQKNSYLAQKVISTIPPNLFIHQIECDPVLPSSFTDVATSTHTWMDDSIKVALSYSDPFWLAPDKSGTIVSNVGPIHEMYDHSNYEKSFYSLMGFFNGGYYTLSKEERLAKIIHQLSKYYGPVAEEYTSYEERVWRQEKDTYHPYPSHIIPHQNNGHKIYQSTYMNNRLIISGTETSEIFPGYMEGAVCSGQRAAKLAL